MKRETRRRTPEEFLRECQAEETAARKGSLKIFLGYASGVGKTFRMLDEVRRRRERGQDVVVGALQPRVPPEVEPLLRELEVMPLRTVAGGSGIDLESLLLRRPTICIIDGLAYDNPPGFRNPTRWQDIQELQKACIKVITSVNVQYVAELREQVEAITGKHVKETVPVSFIKSADEIEIVDATAEESRENSPEESLDAARSRQRLSRLREIALVLAADVVDHQLNDYLESHGINQQFGAHERVMVCITPRANANDMIETARIIAERFHGELIVAYVNQPQISEGDQAALNEKLAIARAAGARVEILDGEDPVEAILDFARSRGVTQLFIGHSQRSGIWPRLWGNPVDKLIRLSRGMDVRVFPQ
jgi:two-component system sensor histidine kinase KdpD